MPDWDNLKRKLRKTVQETWKEAETINVRHIATVV